MSEPSTSIEKLAFILGILTRGIILGLALSAALATLWSWSGGTRTFRYEAF